LTTHQSCCKIGFAVCAGWIELALDPAWGTQTHQAAPHVKTAAGGFGVVLRAFGTAATRLARL
jgi:hypothetical protein